MSNFTRRLGHLVPLKRGDVVRLGRANLPEYFRAAVQKARVARGARPVYSQDYPGMAKSHAEVMRDMLEQQRTETQLLRQFAARSREPVSDDVPALLRPQV